MPVAYSPASRAGENGTNLPHSKSSCGIKVLTEFSRKRESICRIATDFTRVAKTELGVERAWTQAVLEHIANLGLIDRAIADESYARLIDFDYQCTHSDAPDHPCF
jgi:hypothetical protein